MEVSVTAASGAAAANPSVGLNDTAKPFSATLVGGTDGTNLRPFKASATGVLSVDGSAVTQPISAVALPLPAGAATEATLAAMAAKIPAIDGSSTLAITAADVGSASGTVANGQVWITGTPTANSAAIFPVSSIETGMVQISGAWTGTCVIETSQDGGTVYTAHGIHLIGSPVFTSTVTGNIVGSLSLTAKTHLRVRATALTSGSPTVRLGTSDNSNAVYVANAVKLVDSASTSPALMNIKAASTAPLATDTAIVVTLNPNNSANSVAYKVDGSAATQPVSAAALPLPTGAATEVTLAAMSAKIPALGQATMAASQPVVFASNQSALSVNQADVAASGSITTQNLNPTSGAATAGSTVGITSITAGATATVQVTGTYTGALTPQVTLDGTNWVTLNGLSNVNSGALAGSIASGTSGVWLADIAGVAGFRITANAAVTGAAVVTVRISSNTGQVFLGGPLIAGTASIGSVTQGTAGTSAWLIKQGGKTVANRARNDYSTTSVTTAAYVQLLAATSAAVTEVEIFDSSGQTLLLATGAAAAEVDQVYIFPGGNGRIPLQIATATRVSIKAVSGTANVGECTVNFYS